MQKKQRIIQSSLGILMASLLAACASQEKVSLVEPTVLSVETRAPTTPLARENAKIVSNDKKSRESGQHIRYSGPELDGFSSSLQYRTGSIESTTYSSYDKQNNEKYGKVDTNPVKVVSAEPVSTFSIDVDTGSYSNVRRILNAGQLPQTDAVRVEEMINYFPYDYAYEKDSNAPFSVFTEVVDSPWKKDAKLLTIGIKAQDKAMRDLPTANLVFLVDVSGSMSGPLRLDLAKQTLKILTRQLRAEDKVTIISYANGEKLVLPPTSGANKKNIMAAIDSLEAGGGTAGESAIQMAYKEAQKSFVKGGINRIFLATDGDFNVGVTSFDALKDMVAEKRKAGVSLTTLGYGVGNYNERLMEQLADAGNGNYAYIDSEREARKVLQQQLTSTLATVASDVKIQMEFNPDVVQEYRLIGYENRLLKKEDFNNDQVDAGEIGAGHTVTAIYEMTLVGKQGWNDASRYRKKAEGTGKTNEYAFLKVRYKPVSKDKSTLMTWPVAVGSKSLTDANNETRFAIAVAGFGQKLRGGEYLGQWTYHDIQKLAKGAVGKDQTGIRQEFLELVDSAENISSSKK